MNGTMLVAAFLIIALSLVNYTTPDYNEQMVQCKTDSQKFFRECTFNDQLNCQDKSAIMFEDCLENFRKQFDLSDK
jgi:hypothetical protein